MSSILIVDDEAIITMQLEERLSAMGYTVAAMAASGEEAIEKAKHFMPDLVLMDIVMPGTMNGIEAAKVLSKELDIPVVFVTAYADNAIIEQAKSAKPYGYIVKPFNELEIKAAIEVALFRKAAEQEAQNVEKSLGKNSEEGEEDVTYLALPEIKTVLLEDIFADILLFLYTDRVAKDPIFKFALEEGIKKGGRNLFAYSQSTLQKYFPKEISRNELYTHRIRKDEGVALLQILEKCTESLMYAGTPTSLQIMIDFSETEKFADILAIKDLLMLKKDAGKRISGIIALNIGKIDHTLIKILAEGIPKIIVSTGKETTLSFAHHTFHSESVSVVQQSTIDDVVKKLLEPVVLSFLDKPISGYDIVHEIYNRYKVHIPQARVYTILHELLQSKYLEIRISGKSKLYCPTETGKKFISQKLYDFKLVFQHILGGADEIHAEILNK
ncbi:MAG TPA: response regulator [Methanospirillum sp.]|nr:response regulator [Methanospirillum sp.]